MGKLYCGKKREGSSVPNGGSCPGKALDGIPRSGTSCDWLGVHVWLSLVGPKLEEGQKLRKLSVINQVIVVGGQLLLRLLFSFLDWLLKIMDKSSVYMI